MWILAKLLVRQCICATYLVAHRCHRTVREGKQQASLPDRKINARTSAKQHEDCWGECFLCITCAPRPAMPLRLEARLQPPVAPHLARTAWHGLPISSWVSSLTESDRHETNLKFEIRRHFAKSLAWLAPCQRSLGDHAWSDGVWKMVIDF